MSTFTVNGRRQSRDEAPTGAIGREKMADYYPLISKAVSGFSSSQDRRSLYERGRSALMTELHAVKPPLSEATIAKERLAFEEAIRKVEAEEARRARESNKDVP